MTGELTVFTLGGSGMGGALAIAALISHVPIICALLSLLFLFLSKWVRASVFAVLTLCGTLLVCIGENNMLVFAAIVYAAAVCLTAYIKEKKKNPDKLLQQDEVWFDDEWMKKM
jgi:predicted membrane protein